MAVRATHNAEGKLLAVMGGMLYRISQAGVAIPVGAIPGSGRVQVDHNQISLGNEVVAVNGSAGYLWNTVTDAFGRITDPGFPGASTIRFVSGYMVGIEPQGRFAFNSAPAQAGEYNTLDRWTSEVSPDPLVAQGTRGGELLLLSTTSGEFFQATANLRQPFRTKGSGCAFKTTGAAGPHVTFDADSNIWWLGSDGIFYCLNGYSPLRISTRAEELAIQGLDWSRAFAFRWDTVIYWTFPDGGTLGFDFAQKVWHRRASYDLARWRVNSMTRWNERWIAGDFQANRLWDCQRSDDYWLEGDSEYLTRFTMPVLHDNQNRLRMPRLELVMDTGHKATVAIPFPDQPGPPVISGPSTFLYDVGDEIDLTWTAVGGTGVLTFTVRPGGTPLAGGTLASDGEMTGTTTTVSEPAFTVRVTDENGLWDEMDVEGVVEDMADVTLMTTARHYGGPRDDMEPAADLVGWDGQINRVRVNPQGTYAFGFDWDSAPVLEMFKYNASTDTWTEIAHGITSDVNPLAAQWSPDGRYLAIGFNSNDTTKHFKIYKRTGDTFAAIAAASSPLIGAPVRSIAWDSVGARIAVAAGNTSTQFEMYNFASDTLTGKQTFGQGGDGNSYKLAFQTGAASRYLAGGMQAGTTRFVVLYDVSSTPSRRASVTANALCGLGFDADGSHIFTASDGNGADTDFVRVLAITGGVGAEVLTVSSVAAVLPGGLPLDSSTTRNGEYFAVAYTGSSVPMVYEASTAPGPRTLTSLAQTSAGDNVLSVSWSEETGDE